MKKNLILFIIVIVGTCNAQSDFHSTIEFTSDLKKFINISGIKDRLKGVEMIALGENTHGLGEVFKAKTELVKYLHEEMGFDMVIFESGYGDAGMTFENLESLSALDYTRSFSSNFYYQSEEIMALIEYTKTRNGKLSIQGFDCQPKQDYLIKRMVEIFQPVDSVFAKRIEIEMNDFNKLYTYEFDNDSISFYQQREQFAAFLTDYEAKLKEIQQYLLKSGATINELNIISKSIQIFRNTYSGIEFGGLMGWPISAEIRDKALLETMIWFKENNPDKKIIIWAQNSHIENKTKPNYSVNWMGHGLKKRYGDKYYSIGTVVYSGTNLNYDGTFDFEHSSPDYIAHHLNKFGKERFVLDLRKHDKKDFTRQSLIGMENSGNTAEFVAKDRFDGLLFIKYSDIPKLLPHK